VDLRRGCDILRTTRAAATANIPLTLSAPADSLPADSTIAAMTAAPPPQDRISPSRTRLLSLPGRAAVLLVAGISYAGRYRSRRRQ